MGYKSLVDTAMSPLITYKLMLKSYVILYSSAFTRIKNKYLKLNQNYFFVLKKKKKLSKIILYDLSR